MDEKRNQTLTEVSQRANVAFDVERLSFRRTLNQRELTSLRKVCSSAFGEEIHPKIIEMVMHYCCYVERYMEGRADGSIEDLIIRYFMSYYATLLINNSIEDPCHMEIGALFGASTIFTCHAVRLAEKDVPSVVIDPFSGYYDQDVDILTKLPVHEDTLYSNVERFGFDRGMIRLRKGYSAEEEIIRGCAQLRVLSLLIDGDHSYQGVKNDWLNYSPLVVSGGYVLIDDYNNSAWPDITRFVNREILSNLMGKWNVVLVYGSSILLRRTEIVPEKGLSRAEIYYHQFCELEKGIDYRDRIIKDKDTEIKEKMRLIQALYDSKSWRITAPLRWLHRKLVC